jgi:hypothetical protein
VEVEPGTWAVSQSGTTTGKPRGRGGTGGATALTGGANTTMAVAVMLTGAAAGHVTTMSRRDHQCQGPIRIMIAGLRLMAE